MFAFGGEADIQPGALNKPILSGHAPGRRALLLLLLQLPQLKTGGGDRFFDHVAAQVVRRARIRLDDADRIPRAELRRQIVTALVVRERAQALGGIGFENEDVHRVFFPRTPVRTFGSRKGFAAQVHRAAAHP